MPEGLTKDIYVLKSRNSCDRNEEITDGSELVERSKDLGEYQICSLLRISLWINRLKQIGYKKVLFVLALGSLKRTFLI